MNEENNCKNKQCLYCGNYDGYYIKGLHHFESVKKGFCRLKEKIVENTSNCECWKSSNHRYYFRKKAAARALYKILMDISAIRQILQESQDEGKNLQ